MNEPQPSEIATMIDAAVGIHEGFLSLLAAGFTEDQALRYLAYMTIAANEKGEQ